MDFVGGLLTVVGLLFMWRATSIPLLFIGYCFVELFSNCALATLVATIPDQVPENQRGTVSGIFGLATGLGGILGAILAGQIFKSPTNAYVVMFLIVLVPPFRSRSSCTTRCSPRANACFPPRGVSQEFLD